MADNRNGCNLNRSLSSSACGESVIIDTSHVFDSCRDRDCFENVAVFLTPDGQELIERTTNIRVVSATIIASNITVDPVKFNRGFYEVSVRFYLKLELEACVCLGRPSGFFGLAVVEKSVILYGSEGNVNVFKSNNGIKSFCDRPNLCESTSNLPTAVVEVVDPIVLDVSVRECRCQNLFRCCSCRDVPEQVLGCLSDNFDFNEDGRHLVVSLGFFSVIRIERPAQYLINATEYSVPNKECFSTDDASTSPCEVFRNMEFPITEFQPVSLRNIENPGSRNSGCSCNRD